MLIIENINKLAGEFIETNAGVYEIYNIVQKQDLYGFTLKEFDSGAFMQLILSRETHVANPNHYQLRINGFNSQHVMITKDGLKDTDKFIMWIVELIDGNITK